jgi:Glutamine amidotransferase class-I
MSHADKLSKPPPDFHVIGHTGSAPYAAIAHNSKPFYGIQFHPEVTHTPDGKVVIGKFILDICGCKQNWTMVKRTVSVMYVFLTLDFRKNLSGKKLHGFEISADRKAVLLERSVEVLIVRLLQS